MKNRLSRAPVLRAASLVAVLLMVGDAAVWSQAAPAGCPQFRTYVAYDFEQITVSTTAIGFTPTKSAPSGLAPADAVYVTVETNAVRYRDDGTNPTAAVGQPLAVNQTGWVCGPGAIAKTKFIRQTADATVDATFYRGAP